LKLMRGNDKKSSSSPGRSTTLVLIVDAVSLEKREFWSIETVYFVGRGVYNTKGGNPLKALKGGENGAAKRGGEVLRWIIEIKQRVATDSPGIIAKVGSEIVGARPSRGGDKEWDINYTTISFCGIMGGGEVSAGRGLNCWGAKTGKTKNIRKNEFLRHETRGVALQNQEGFRG